jgi:hypothetical protein
MSREGCETWGTDFRAAIGSQNPYPCLANRTARHGKGTRVFVRFRLGGISAIVVGLAGSGRGGIGG